MKSTLLKRLVRMFLLALFVGVGGSWIVCPGIQVKPPSARVYYLPRGPYMKYVDEVYDSFAAQMFGEYGLIQITAGGDLGETVKQMRVWFQIHRRASLVEARTLQMEVINRFVEAINAHPKLQPFLAEFPFTHRHVGVSITFTGGNGGYIDGVAYVTNSSERSTTDENEERIFYCGYDTFACDEYDECSSHLTDLYDETYEEAMQLVKDVPVQIHENTPEETQRDQMFYRFWQKMREKYRLNLRGIVFGENGCIRLKFFSLDRASVANARKLIFAVADELLLTLNENFRLRLWEVPFPSSQIKLCIYFEKNPLLKRAILEDNHVTYLRLPDGLHRSKVVAQEPYVAPSERASQNRLVGWRWFLWGKNAAKGPAFAE